MNFVTFASKCVSCTRDFQRLHSKRLLCMGLSRFEHHFGNVKYVSPRPLNSMVFPMTQRRRKETIKTKSSSFKVFTSISSKAVPISSPNSSLEEIHFRGRLPCVKPNLQGLCFLCILTNTLDPQPICLQYSKTTKGALDALTGVVLRQVREWTHVPSSIHDPTYLLLSCHASWQVPNCGESVRRLAVAQVEGVPPRATCLKRLQPAQPRNQASVELSP